MKDYSQNGEQAHILRILDTIGIEKGHLIDFGAGDSYTMSNTRALLDKGWTGDLYDGDPRGAKDVIPLWITTEAVQHLNPGCDFLNIDLDGNDYYILREALQNSWYRQPALIVAEINPIFERNESKVIPYDPNHTWDGSVYYGMSLAACEALGRSYGYTLCYLHAGINAFLLRNDHAEAHPELIRPIEYKVKHDHKPHKPGLPWLTA